MRRVVFCLIAAALSPAWAQITDSRGDQIVRESLLRRYTTGEAQRRYDARQLSTPTPAAGAVGALGNMFGRMAAQQQERTQLINTVNLYLRRDAELDLSDERIASAVKHVLARDDDGEVYEWFARKRIVEYELHQRPGSEVMFKQPNPRSAAERLRTPAYAGATDGYQPRAAMMLARLYLIGYGVPRDPTEALDLLEGCAEVGRFNAGRPKQPGVTPKFSDPDFVACHVTLARLHRSALGTEGNTKLADEHMNRAREIHEKATRKRLSDDQLRAVYE